VLSPQPYILNRTLAALPDGALLMYCDAVCPLSMLPLHSFRISKDAREIVDYQERSWIELCISKLRPQ
jgi:hypothetical protein